MAPKPRPVIDRLMEKVRVEPSGCWAWTASRSREGYGKIGVKGKILGAHRVSYELHVGPVPDGLHLDHLCRNRACVNPAHLEPVTAGENARRGEGFSGKKSRQTHCLHGHQLIGDNLRISTYSGHTHRWCRTCARQRAAKYRARDAAGEKRAGLVK